MRAVLAIFDQNHAQVRIVTSSFNFPAGWSRWLPPDLLLYFPSAHLPLRSMKIPPTHLTNVPSQGRPTLQGPTVRSDVRLWTLRVPLEAGTTRNPDGRIVEVSWALLACIIAR
jgi:hypothetical protein